MQKASADITTARSTAPATAYTQEKVSRQSYAPLLYVSEEFA
jgi:hypothetical protein